MVPKRWPAWQPQNLNGGSHRRNGDGDLFNVITYGRRTMPPTDAQNRPEDRWAIIAYCARIAARRARNHEGCAPELQSSVDYKGTAMNHSATNHGAQRRPLPTGIGPLVDRPQCR
jgi:hypothetical protein